MRAEPFLCHRQEEVVTCSIEVSRIVRTLEILATELSITHLYYTAFVAVVKHRDAVLLAHLLYCLAYWHKARSIHVPRCDVANLCLRTKTLDTHDKRIERIDKHPQ